jgi:radical SAM protein with 4Fe4S-binding SPASM domain
VKKTYLNVLLDIMKKSKVKRFINALKTFYSWQASNITGRARIYGMPVSLGIELTSCCNLNCPECTTGSGILTRKAGFITSDLFDKIIGDAGNYLLNINLYFQGEPMLHPSFFSFTDKIRNIPVTVSTNGHFLSADNSKALALSGIRKLIVSLDGMDQATYSAYRINGDFETVVAGIRNLSAAISKYGSSLRLEIQFLVNLQNESHIQAARKFASEVNAKLILKSMQVLDESRAEGWLPTIEKFRRYRNENGKFIHKGRIQNRCLRLWLNPVVTWDGKVIPCCFDKNADHILGDINTHSLSEIWYGEKANKFRQSLLDDRSKIDICTNCTTGLSGVKY